MKIPDVRTVGEKTRKSRGFYFNVAKAEGLRKQANGADAGSRGKSQIMMFFQCKGVWTSPGSGFQEKNIINKKKCPVLGMKL